MAEYPYFYNSDNHDRVYDAGSFEEWLRYFFTTGVFVDTCFVREKTGMQVQLDSGYCNIRGKVMIWDAPEFLTLMPSHATMSRIDNIVIERNDTDRNFYRKVVTGEYANNPVAPEPVRAAGVYQLVVARIRVPAGATVITQSSITDTRPNVNLCGYVAGTVREMDFSQFTAQFERFFEEFKTNNTEEFEQYKDASELEIREFFRRILADMNRWYDHIRDSLTPADAGRLQTQIDDLMYIINGETGFKMPIKTKNGDLIKTAQDAILAAKDTLVKMSELNAIVYELKQYMKANYAPL